MKRRKYQITYKLNAQLLHYRDTKLLNVDVLLKYFKSNFSQKIGKSTTQLCL